MTAPKPKARILALLRDRSQEATEQFFQREAIVLALFRSLSAKEQSTVMLCLSHSPERIFMEEKQLSEMRKRLQSFGVLRATDAANVLNPTFRATLLRGLAEGLKPLFVRVEGPAHATDFGMKWTEVYAYILRHVSGNSGTALSKGVCAVLDAQKLIVQVETGKRATPSAGFAFLVAPVSAQVNQFLLEYLLAFDRKTLGLDVGQASMQDLMELFCHLSFLPADVPFAIEATHTRLPRAALVQVFGDLASAGLLDFQPQAMRLVASSLLSDFLSSTSQSSRLLPTRIIVENDFRIYVYTQLGYVKYLLSLFADIKVVFNGMFIASLNEHKLASAFQQGVTHEMIVRFLESQIHPCVLERKAKDRGKTEGSLLPYNFLKQLTTIEQSIESFLEGGDAAAAQKTARER